jgi:peptidylprolyl isomerase
MRLKTLAIAIITVLVSISSTFAAGGRDLENTLYLQLKDGRVVIELLPDVAPQHVARIKELARAKFYDGIVFHRVIDGFMAQTGDPTGTGTGGSDKPNLPAEFNGLSHKRGTLSMARSSARDSANSQFFIVLKDSDFLDGQYTIWGRVVEGMEHVDKIKRGDERNNGSVQNPDKMISVKVAADVEGKQSSTAPVVKEKAKAN